MPDIKAQALSFAESLSALGDAEEKLKSFNQAIDESKKRLEDARAEEAANAERVKAEKDQIAKDRREASDTLARAQKIYNDKLDDAAAQAKRLVDAASAKAKATLDGIKDETASLKKQRDDARAEAVQASEEAGRVRDALAQVKAEAVQLARRLAT